MTEKIYKPKTCKECPVGINNKGKITCGVSRNKLIAQSTNIKEMKEMYEKCPIDWDR